MSNDPRTILVPNSPADDPTSAALTEFRSPIGYQVGQGAVPLVVLAAPSGGIDPIDPLFSAADNADNVAVSALLNKLVTINRLTGFDGTNWDRIRALTDADAMAAAVIGQLATLARLQGFNGTTFDRLRTNAAAVLAGTTQPFGQLVAQPGQWAINHAPGPNIIATATRAAGAAGVRHVLQNVSCGIVAAALAQPIIGVVVRDGATGVGAVLFTIGSVAQPTVGATDRISLNGLNVVGSAATAMTVEFLALPAVGNFENVNAMGYSTI